MTSSLLVEKDIIHKHITTLQYNSIDYITLYYKNQINLTVINHQNNFQLQ